MAQTINRRDEPDRTSNVTAEDRKRAAERKKKKPEKEEPKRDVIELGGEKKEERGTISKVFKTDSGKFRTDLTGQFEKQTGKKVINMVYTGPSFGGTSLIGNRIPDATVEAAGKAAGLTKKGIGQLKFALGQKRVQQVANTLTNPKAAGLLKTAMSKIFSKEAMVLVGSLAGTVGLGKWAQKETAEPVTVAMTQVLKQALITGDWTLYEEAKLARDDLTDMTKWEQYLSWTPIISPFITIPKAIKGVIQGGKILDEVANQAQIAQETGESEEDKWKRIDEERKATKEAERIADEAYYAQVQKDIASAKADARREDERYWNKVLQEREAYEKAKKEAEQKYWDDVRKANEEIRKEEAKAYQDYGKSNLDFGLL